jgi:hypothetical protein
VSLITPLIGYARIASSADAAPSPAIDGLSPPPARGHLLAVLAGCCSWIAPNSWCRCMRLRPGHLPDRRRLDWLTGRDCPDQGSGVRSGRRAELLEHLAVSGDVLGVMELNLGRVGLGRDQRFPFQLEDDERVEKRDRVSPCGTRESITFGSVATDVNRSSWARIMSGGPDLQRSAPSVTTNSNCVRWSYRMVWRSIRTATAAAMSGPAV